MLCTACHSPIEAEPKEMKPRTYHGTKTYVLYNQKNLQDMWHFHKNCFDPWWASITHALDCIDERMNSNIYFHRTAGSRGIYRDESYEHPTEVDASWTGQDARHMGITSYKFKHRRS